MTRHSLFFPTDIKVFSSVKIAISRSLGENQTPSEHIQAENLVSQHLLFYLGDNNFLQQLVLTLKSPMFKAGIFSDTDYLKLMK